MEPPGSGGSNLSVTFLHLICFAARMATRFVSLLRFGSGLYDDAGLLGVPICGCAGRGLDVVPCWWSLYICVCGFFSVVAELCILPSCWGWGRLFLSLFWCGCSALFPGAPAVFRCVHAASYPSRVPHLADSGWLPYSCGCPDSPLGFYLVSEQLPLPLLPLWGSAPLTGASACLSSLLVYSWGWVGGVFATSLGFLPCICSSSGPAACAAFPAVGSLGVFPVTGCLSFSFPGGVGWGFSPFLLFLGFSCSACLLGKLGFCTLCQGAPVAVVSAWFAGEVTLLPFPYLRVSVLLACGVSGVCGLRWRSRLPFVVRHDLGFADACSGCWLVLVPAVFWTLPWVLPSRFQVGCWL